MQISRRTASGRALVFASIGPSGRLLVNGDVTTEELRVAFQEQARAQAGAGADALVIETMTDLEEAKLAVAAACDTGLPVVACMVFDSGRNKDRTMMGTTLEQSAEPLIAAGADVVGANCGQGIDGFAAICKRLRAATDHPVWLKPNAGLPKLADCKVQYDVSPVEFAISAARLVEAGAHFIGGCCGTNPDFIRAIHRHLQKIVPVVGTPGPKP